MVWIEMRRARTVGFGGVPGRFRQDRNPTPVAHTIPQASVVIPVGRISQGPVGDHDYPGGPSRKAAG